LAEREGFEPSKRSSARHNAKLTAQRTQSVHLETDCTRAIAPNRHLQLPLTNIVTGHSLEALAGKISRCNWIEAKVWRHAPDRRNRINLVGFGRWWKVLDFQRSWITEAPGCRLLEASEVA